MPRNTGRGTRSGVPQPGFRWAKAHGGLLGNINPTCRVLRDRCPHVATRAVLDEGPTVKAQ